jgi:hypothetical protein
VRSISDAVIAPKPFSGKPDQDAEAWFDYFERCAKFRKLRPPQKREFFSLLLSNGVVDWLMTLTASEGVSYAQLAEALKKSYFRSPELKWREAEELWATTQNEGANR